MKRMSVGDYFGTRQGKEVLLLLSQYAAIPSSKILPLIIRAFPFNKGVSGEDHHSQNTITRKLRFLQSACRCLGRMDEKEFLKIATCILK